MKKLLVTIYMFIIINIFSICFVNPLVPITPTVPNIKPGQISVRVKIKPCRYFMMQVIYDKTCPWGLNTTINYDKDDKDKDKVFKDKVKLYMYSNVNFNLKITTDYDGPGNFYLKDRYHEYKFNSNKSIDFILRKGVYNSNIEYRFSYKNKEFYDIKSGEYNGKIYVTMYPD
ncbi:hypothetical protein OSSY52_20330 [Tepiditoga spiralis]|uniref:Uncharacterized protein n=1 Tax=Tepiditoga spiralis TaxID=2108365 RepID=A0A7G1GBQ6_9BACT|nr:hypothetical protein [Tepiditoga spiralis]BBE31892.1 hypothetical protein OSSY52_20330 [Tepiditoga spiralis]